MILTLFLTFAKIGLFTFGGGYAMISVLFNNFLETAWIANAFKGIRIAVGMLILDAGINMFVKMKKKVFPCVIMGCSLAAMLLISIFAWTFSSVFLMLIAAVASLVIFIIQGAPSEKGDERN
jgi:chromate transporter